MTLADLPTIAEVDAECERRRVALVESAARKAAAAVQAALLDRFMEAVTEYRARIEAGEAHPGTTRTGDVSAARWTDD